MTEVLLNISFVNLRRTGKTSPQGMAREQREALFVGVIGGSGGDEIAAIFAHSSPAITTRRVVAKYR